MKKCDNLIRSDAEFKQEQGRFVVDRSNRWRMDTVNSETLLRHMSDTTGINISIFYIRGAFTYSLFHIEDEEMSSISFYVREMPRLGT